MNLPVLRHLLAALCAVLLATAMPFAQAQGVSQEELECGPLIARARVAPMDYRTNRRMLAVVEAAHFPPSVEMLIKPRLSTFGAALDYTLHAYPNHVRALVTMMKLEDREHTVQPKGMQYTVDCFFRRAIRFVPDDLVVRMLYAKYLNKHQRHDDAMAQLRYVESFAGDDPMTRHNLGLMYVEMGAFDRALAQAHEAIRLGFDRPDLRAALAKSGHWQEPSAAGAASAPEASTAAPSPAVPPPAGAASSASAGD